MHAIVYNFHSLKEIYNDIIDNLINQDYKDGWFKVIIVWSFISNNDFENISNLLQKKDIQNIEIVLTSNISFAKSRNLGIFYSTNSTDPLKYLTLVEDDHYIYLDSLKQLEAIMDKYWGKTINNTLKIGMFTTCFQHTNAELTKIDNNIYIPSLYDSPDHIGGINSCFRSAPIYQFLNIVGEYALDEYPISYYQTASQNIKNYNKGYTVMFYDTQKIINHKDSDIKENSFGAQTVGVRFNTHYTKSHLEFLKNNKIELSSKVSFENIVKIMLEKLLKKIKFKK